MTWLEPAMTAITRWVGHPLMVPGGLLFIGTLYWLFGVDVANFSLSLLTFGLLPILQHSQSKGENALHAKLDEVIRSSDARNSLIGLDKKSEKEIEHERIHGGA